MAIDIQDFLLYFFVIYSANPAIAGVNKKRVYIMYRGANIPGLIIVQMIIPIIPINVI